VFLFFFLKEGKAYIAKPTKALLLMKENATKMKEHLVFSSLQTCLYLYLACQKQAALEESNVNIQFLFLFILKKPERKKN